MHESCEPAMFSLEQLLFAVATDQRSSNDLLTQILPLLTDVYEKEKTIRKDLKVCFFYSERLDKTVIQYFVFLFSSYRTLV